MSYYRLDLLQPFVSHISAEHSCTRRIQFWDMFGTISWLLHCMYSIWRSQTQLSCWNRTNDAFEMRPHCEPCSFHAAPKDEQSVDDSEKKDRRVFRFTSNWFVQPSIDMSVLPNKTHSFWCKLQLYEFQVMWSSALGFWLRHSSSITTLFNNFLPLLPFPPTNCTFSGALISRELAILCCRSRNVLSTRSLRSYRGCQGISCVIVTVCSCNCFSPGGLRRWEIGLYATLDSLSFICLSTV